MSECDYYQVLGVPRSASPSQLRAAFARQAKRHHPDLALPGAHVPHRLPTLHEAFRCLSQPDQRAAYDQALAERERRHAAAQRRLRRRLRRFDHGGRRSVARPGWRWMALLACAAAATVQLSLQLVG